MDEPELAGRLSAHATEHGVPGAAVGILRDGQMTIAHHGLSDTGTGEPVGPETRFAVGSLGKSMMATAIARLAGAGRLSLDDPVSARVPELRGVGWAERATLRALIANRSQVPLRVELEFTGWPDEDDAVLSRVATKVAAAEPMPPIWSYSNAGWCLLGRAMETATGQTWPAAMRTHLLDPLGLTETVFTTGPGGEPRAKGHNGTTPVADWTPVNLAPAGSTLLSTVVDLLRVAAAQIDDPALAMLRTTQEEVRLHSWLDAWCLGWSRFDWAGGPVWGWDGVMNGQRSFLRFHPDRRAAVAMLTNSASGRPLYRSLFPELLRAYAGVEMTPLPLDPSPGAAGDLTRFEGTYAWTDRRWDVSATGTGLVLKGTHDAVEAVPIDDRTFLVDARDPDNPTVTFGAFDDSGRPGALYQMLWAFPRV